MINFEQIKTFISAAVNSLKRRDLVDGIANPYKQFNLTIADGEARELFYNFNYFRILEITNSTGVSIRFGSSGTPTDVVGAGIGYEMPSVVDRATIINQSGGAITIKLGLAVGRIDDDRLAVSGAIKTSVGSNFGAATDVTVPDSTSTVVLSSDESRRTAIITNLSDSHSVRLKGVSGAVVTGIIVYPNQTVFLDVTSAIYAYQESGSSVSLAVGDIGD